MTTYTRTADGMTYYYMRTTPPMLVGAPTNLDGSVDTENFTPVSDFDEPLSKADLLEIEQGIATNTLNALHAAQRAVTRGSLAYADEKQSAAWWAIDLAISLQLGCDYTTALEMLNKFHNKSAI